MLSPNSNYALNLSAHNPVVNDLRRNLREYIYRKEYFHGIDIQISDKVKEALLTELKKINLNPYNQFDKILGLLKQKSISNIFYSDNTTNRYKAPIIFLQNLPIDEDLVLTPLDDGLCLNKDYISEYTLLLLASMLGVKPYINRDEKSNSIIQNIIPILGRENELSEAGSSATFNWHTENIHEENPADYFILLALRGDKNAYTSFMLVKDIVDTLPKSMVDDLLITPFIMKTGPSYTRELTKKGTILSKDKYGDFNINYNSDRNRCIPINKKGELLYNAFQDYLQRIPSYYVSLRQGDAVILNNKKALHKRDGFQISTSLEERRWLQVIYLKRKFIF